MVCSASGDSTRGAMAASPRLSAGFVGAAVLEQMTAESQQAAAIGYIPRPAHAAVGGGKLARLIRKGERLFFEETFDGNGRTCGTCHPAENNFAIDPEFIATLPNDDPLFVAEFVPALAVNFENPLLMREFGLILENNDGFGDLAADFNMRGVPHTLALPTSIDDRGIPRTGWSGDGAPIDGELRSFAIGAVTQHFPKTLGRAAGVDFRLPTEDELDAMAAFQLSLGRQEDLSLPLALTGYVAALGQDLFLDNTNRCNVCHMNAGANFLFGGGNRNFDTGVEDLVDQPADLTAELVPADDGLGVPGDFTFNTPTLVEAADTGPFFHNNAIETIEGAVAFYNDDAFNKSPAADAGIIKLDATQVVAIAAFLRVINALENIRQAIDYEERALASRRRTRVAKLLDLAAAETADALEVLDGGGLHPVAQNRLERALARLSRSKLSKSDVERAILLQERARDDMIED